MIRFGIPDRYVTHGKPELLHEEVGLTAERVAERVLGALDRSDALHERAEPEGSRRRADRLAPPVPAGACGSETVSTCGAGTRSRVGRVLAEQRDEQERDEPHDVEVEPVDRDELRRDQDGGAERRDLEGVAPAGHERDRDGEADHRQLHEHSSGRGPGSGPRC